MRRYLELLAEVARTGQQKQKESLLKKGDSAVLRDLLYFAFSPTVTFRVGAVEFERGGIDSEYDNREPVEFLQLCGKLSRRELTGDLAKQAVTSHIEGYPSYLRIVARDIFAQKLSIGMDAKRINKVFPGLIPTFGVQLAEEYEPGRLEYPVWVSSKLDGMRAVVIHDSKSTVMWTRQGKNITGVPFVLEAVKTLPYGVYDGELMHPKGFQLTVSICRHGEENLHPLHNEVEYHIFDYTSIDDWVDPKTPADSRFTKLERSIMTHWENTEVTPLRFVKHNLVHNSKDLMEWHRHYLKEGHEGTMIQGNLPYKKKRSYDIMKLKDFFTLDALVTGWEHGDKTGKYKDLMGKLLCVDIKTGRDFKVGSGFVDEDRQVTDGWIGKAIEVKYQNFTDEGKPRFPVYIRTREDIDTRSLVIPTVSTTEKE